MGREVDLFSEDDGLLMCFESSRGYERSNPKSFVFIRIDHSGPPWYHGPTVSWLRDPWVVASRHTLQGRDFSKGSSIITALIPVG